MTDRGMKQRPLQTQVTTWSLFFSYFNFNEQGGPQGQAGPSPRTLEGLLPGGHTARDPCCAASSPGRAESALGVGTGVWGEEGLRLWARGQEIDAGGVKNTHYLFFGFVKGRRENGMGLRACSAVAAQVQRGPVQLPRPFAPSPGGRLPLPGSERWPGGPGEGSTSLPPLPFQNLIQCFFVWEPGPKESTLLASAVVCPTQYTHPTPQGLSLVPCPQDNGPFLTKEPAHVGAQTQAVYSSFLSCHPRAVSLHLPVNKMQRNQELGERSGVVGAQRPALPFPLCAVNIPCPSDPL